MDRIQQLLGRAKFKLSLDTNFNYKLNLEASTALLKNNLNKIVSTLSQEQVFREERLGSKIYRFSGRLNVITDNSINTTLEDSTEIRPNTKDWDPLFYSTDPLKPPSSPNNWVLQILYPYKIDKYSNLESDEAYRGINVDTLTNKNASGTKEQVYLKTKQKHGLFGGEFCYLYSKTTSSQYNGIHQIEFLGDNGKDVSNGLRLKTKFNSPENNLLLKKIVRPSDSDINFTNPKSTILRVSKCDVSGGTNNQDYTKIITGDLLNNFNSRHGLRDFDYIDLRTEGGNYFLNGLHRVENVIDLFTFIIDLKLPSNIGDTIDNPSVKWRRLDGTPSDYYIRKFKLISGIGYDVVRATKFGTSIYPESKINTLGVANDTWLFTFLEDINVDDLYSHRGGELTQLYIGTIKRSGQNTFNWSNVTAHWDFQSRVADSNSNLEIVSERVANSIGSIEKQEKGISEYFGDFVEYNRNDLRENIISNVIHRFAKNDDNTPSRGYYVKPFQKIEIKKFSNNIEKSVKNEITVGIPGDSETRPNGDVIWRDILESGYIEDGNNGVDYPFMNGSHYIYTNKHIFVFRQNPDVSYTTITNETPSVDPSKIC